MTKSGIRKAVKRALERGNWMIRQSDGGKSYRGFEWAPVGEWTEAPDWDRAPRCGGGLHGQAREGSGYSTHQPRLEFCETSGERVVIHGEKIKVRRARILLVDALPAGLEMGGGTLYLEGCTSLTALPAGLEMGGGSLYLEGCTSLTALPADLAEKINAGAVYR